VGEQDTSGEILLRRLRRLTARARAIEAGDKKQLVALVDDLEIARAALLRECAQLDDELNKAAVRETAIHAYARQGRGVRPPPRRH